jgi:hypothetical protein
MKTVNALLLSVALVLGAQGSAHAEDTAPAAAKRERSSFGRKAISLAVGAALCAAGAACSPGPTYVVDPSAQPAQVVMTQPAPQATMAEIMGDVFMMNMMMHMFGPAPSSGYTNYQVNQMLTQHASELSSKQAQLEQMSSRNAAQEQELQSLRAQNQKLQQTRQNVETQKNIQISALKQKLDQARASAAAPSKSPLSGTATVAKYPSGSTTGYGKVTTTTSFSGGKIGGGFGSRR